MSKKPWTRQEILEHLREFEHEHGFAGAWRLERAKREGYIRFRLAMRREFGSLRRAKEIAGVKTWPLWTKEKVQEELLALARRGEKINSRSVSARHPRLAAGAHRAYGTWRKALEASGVELRRILGPEGWTRAQGISKVRWTRESVLLDIGKEHQGGGEMTDVSVLARRPTLYWAAKKRFGSWRKALRVAGIPIPPLVRKASPWTPERILRVLREDAEEGRDLRAYAVVKRRSGLVNQARRHFHSWREALMAAGVPLPRRLSKWTPETILEFLRRARKRGCPLGSGPMRQKGGIYDAAVREFGNWREALRAAGIAWEDRLGPRNPKRPPPKPARLKRPAVSAEEIRTLVHARAKVGDPLHVTAVRRTHPRLVHAALRMHGSWSKTLRSCGLDPDQFSLRKQWTRQKVLQALQDEARSGRTLSTTRIGRTYSSLYRAARILFGSWESALHSAGLSAPRQGRPPSTWTREQILGSLRRLWETGRDVRIRSVNEHSAGLSCAAYRLFGSWKMTLEAADIPWEQRLLARCRRPAIHPGASVPIPCRHCLKLSRFTIEQGRHTLECTTCGRTTGVEGFQEGGRWRIRTRPEPSGIQPNPPGHPLLSNAGGECMAPDRLPLRS